MRRFKYHAELVASAAGQPWPDDWEETGNIPLTPVQLKEIEISRRMPHPRHEWFNVWNSVYAGKTDCQECKAYYKARDKDERTRDGREEKVQEDGTPCSV